MGGGTSPILYSWRKGCHPCSAFPDGHNSAFLSPHAVTPAPLRLSAPVETSVAVIAASRRPVDLTTPII